MVIRYAYLWRAEHERGIEEGAKDRPCAVPLARMTRRVLFTAERVAGDTRRKQFESRTVLR
jgi:hypothetical protein